MADILDEAFKYSADQASDCDFVIPGQGGADLDVSKSGFAVASLGFDLTFLPRVEGPLTPEEVEEIRGLAKSWSPESDMVNWPQLQDVCQESLSFGSKAFNWDRHTKLIPAPIVKLREMAYRVIKRLMTEEPR
jgi:hypothetical protein